MPLPKVLIIGRTGQVGWELRRCFAPLAEVVAVDYPEINLTDADALRALVRDTQPRVVINAAAYTAVDKAELEAELCQTINGIAPGVLAEAAREEGALLVHYSTDYVFGGTQRTPYVEMDLTNPPSVYGATKLAGDLAVQEAGGEHLIFRLCWVYGTRGNNFLRTMQRLARERETLRVVHDQTGCPTWSRLIAQATTLAVMQVLAAPVPEAFNGVYHLAAGGSTTWHGFAARIIEQLPEAERKCRVVQPIPSSEYPTPAKRPAYSVLNCLKLEQTFGLKLPDWSDCLDLVLEP
jgi:dTDP-4-dehydrorhamnose reductase